MRYLYVKNKTVGIWMWLICIILFQVKSQAQNPASVTEKKKMYHEQVLQNKKYPVAKALSERKKSSVKRQIAADAAKLPVLKTAEGKLAYCYLLTEDGFSTTNGIYSISVSDPTQMEIVHPSSLNVTSGTYVNGKVYLQTYTETTPVSLVVKDDATGKETVVAEYGNDDPIFLDMTLDPVSNTLYAVGGQYYAEALCLYSIDQATGEYTELFYLYSNILTVAADNDGKLYGIDDLGSFCEINVEEQYSMEIGFTGEWPMYVQSMAFDPSDNTLYWAAFTSDNTSFFAVIDPETCELTKLSETVGNNAEVAALYFRTDPAAMAKPVAPDNFQVVPAANGGLSATLEWNNPTEMLNGEPLSQLTRVDVYCNGERIHQIENAVPGDRVVWTDEVLESGLYSYVVVPVNENGEGLSAESPAVFVGRDVPGLVSDLRIVPESGSYVINVSWNAPSEGKNGGWFDASSLVYDVVRFPDNKLLAEAIATTSFSDQTITETYGYSYGIVAINSDGRGDTLRSETEIVGPDLEVPFFSSFRTEQERGLWKIEDTNADNCTWHYGSNFAGTADWYLEYYANESGTVAANDWFFSAPIRMEAGKRYVLNYDVRLGATLSQEKFRVVLCDGASSERQVQEIDNRTDFYSNFLLENASVAFTPDQSGSYSLGFQCYSDANQYFVQITNVEVKEVEEIDLACTKIYGMPVAVVSDATRYEVYVSNEGATPAEQFRVEVCDEKGHVVGSVDVSDVSLGLNETLIVPVSCLMQDVSSAQKLTGRVRMEGDGRSDNDTVVFDSVEVLSDVNYKFWQVGDWKDGLVSAFVPVDLSQRYSACQMLYTPDMLGFDQCTIERIGVNYSVSQWLYADEYAKDVNLKIYMMNSEDVFMGTFWLPQDDFTLVYDGILSLDEHNNALMLTLDEPFNYIGKSLYILFVTDGGKEDYYYNFFHSSVNKGATCSLSYSDEYNPFDTSKEGVDSESYADFTFILKDVGTGLDGNIKYSPIELLLTGDQLSVYGDYERLAIYAMDGTRLYATEYTTGKINMSGLAEGVYMIVLDCGTFKEVRKLVLVR